MDATTIGAPSAPIAIPQHQQQPLSSFISQSLPLHAMSPLLTSAPDGLGTTPPSALSARKRSKMAYEAAVSSDRVARGFTPTASSIDQSFQKLAVSSTPSPRPPSTRRRQKSNSLSLYATLDDDDDDGRQRHLLTCFHSHNALYKRGAHTQATTQPEITSRVLVDCC